MPAARSAGCARAFASSNEELGSALATIKQLATHDTLTGLPNRALFTESLTRALARAERHGWPVALFFMDLDRFKNINDTLGHQLGDEALKEAARRISSCIRDSDISARLGGDEFVLLVEEFEGPTVLIEIAERILAAIYQPLSIGGHELNLSASIGICTFPLDAKDAGTLLSNADIAMYQAKEQGRNRYRFYSPRYNEHSVERLALETGLRYAIERDELVLLYQPKISIPHRAHRRRRGACCAGSIRSSAFCAPTGSFRSPRNRASSCRSDCGCFAPRVPRRECGAKRECRCRLPSTCRRASSTMGGSSPTSPGFSRRPDSQPGELELEITESTVMQNPEQAVTLMEEMRRLGVRLAMDDFGIGYSSIGHLKHFPIDSLKLDRTFVRDLPDDINDVAITRAVIAMAHTLGINVVAEGVEREAQLELLRAEGCDEYQGYLCQAPLALAELVPFVRGSGSFAMSGAGSVPMPRPRRLRRCAATIGGRRASRRQRRATPILSYRSNAGADHPALRRRRRAPAAPTEARSRLPVRRCGGTSGRLERSLCGGPAVRTRRRLRRGASGPPPRWVGVIAFRRDVSPSQTASAGAIRAEPDFRRASCRANREEGRLTACAAAGSVAGGLRCLSRRGLSVAALRRGAGASSFFGAGRQTMRSLPRCWTAAAPSSSQMRVSIASRSARASLHTRTLINSCAFRLTSISCSTAGRKSVEADADDRMQVMRLGAKRAAFAG